MEIAASTIVSPLFLTELSELLTASIVVRACTERTSLRRRRRKSPSFLSIIGAAAAEMQNCFPVLSDLKWRSVSRVLTMPRYSWKKWGISCEWRGYSEGDKNKIRQIAAAIYAVVKKQTIEKSATEYNYNEPVPVGDITKILKNKVCTSFELALFMASCLDVRDCIPYLPSGKRASVAACGCTTTALRTA